jgi:hypothetical protein
LFITYQFTHCAVSGWQRNLKKHFCVQKNTSLI